MPALSVPVKTSEASTIWAMVFFLLSVPPFLVPLTRLGETSTSTDGTCDLRLAPASVGHRGRPGRTGPDIGMGQRLATSPPSTICSNRHHTGPGGQAISGSPLAVRWIACPCGSWDAHLPGNGWRNDAWMRREVLTEIGGQSDFSPWSLSF